MTGIALGGYIDGTALADPQTFRRSAAMRGKPGDPGITSLDSIRSTATIRWAAPCSVARVEMPVGGGFLVAFDARRADRCTSGHGIMGRLADEDPRILARRSGAR